MRLDVISASAGTGKTYRLTQELVKALLEGSARPEGVVAITYTVKAANELASRIRRALLEEQRPDLAERILDGYIGTIHSVCQRLLGELALEAGLSPVLEPIPDTERAQLFDRALASVIRGREPELNALARRLSVEDWKAELRGIVDKARENGLDQTALARSRASSERGFAAILPALGSSAAGYVADLVRSLERLVPVLDAAAAESDAARKRATRASAVLADAKRFGLPAWKLQVQLAKELGAKKLAQVAGPLIGLVGTHLECAAFREDLLAFQRALFDLAGQALGAFTAEKAAARVLDFGDMLAMAFDLLSRPQVREALRGRLDLVLVDEFQDTSPIQLAVVAALGSVAGRSIWVGDRKQAIFAFQGSDPDLMAAAMDVVLEGREPDILGVSWRSRPALVELVSDLFAPALLPHGFPEKQVRLSARPDPKTLAGQPAFEVWRWPSESGAKEPEAVAAGVVALLGCPPTVRERVEGGEERLRPASRRDIAVLAFSNPKCQAIAAALQARGVPAKVSLEDLPGTPEALLVRAALALLADPSDGVAALEVTWLGGAAAADPDAWLARRFAEVANWRQACAAAEE
ncbi:MAG: UvrD-helicase domain-containing protein, partial [Myxococcaceae bacterium]